MALTCDRCGQEIALGSGWVALDLVQQGVATQTDPVRLLPFRARACDACWPAQPREVPAGVDHGHPPVVAIRGTVHRTENQRNFGRQLFGDERRRRGRPRKAKSA